MPLHKTSNRIVRNFRFTQAANQRLRERAGKANMNDTEFLHHLILDVSDSGGDYHKELCDLQREINAIGRNINQVVKKINKGFYDNLDIDHLNQELKKIRILLYDIQLLIDN